MPELLVSVRDAAEARLALTGHAALIDVKEPTRGSLGRADDAVLSAVVDAVAGARPVSCALGELGSWDEAAVLPTRLGALAYLKWGLAAAPPDWAERLVRLREQIESTSPCRVVLTAYADHRRARAPTPREVCHRALHDRHHVLLVDTAHKDGTTLLDWLGVNELADLVEACRAGGVRVALAGGLGSREIEQLARLRPDWFAVRGAACAHGDRGGSLDLSRLRALADLVSRSTPAG